MKKNQQIIITRHACERYLERFEHAINTGDAEKNIQIAEKFLQHSWLTSSYLCDDEDGILFRSGDMDMLIRQKKMITVMRVNKKRPHFFTKDRDERFNREGANIPPRLKHKINY